MLEHEKKPDTNARSAITIRPQLLPFVSRASEALVPSQFVDFALVFPVFAATNQPGSNGVIADVFPFLFVGLFRPHSNVPMIRLPSMVGDLVTFRELRLPVLTPILVGNYGSLGCRREEMDVIGHDHETPHQPLGRLGPNITN